MKEAVNLQATKQQLKLQLSPTVRQLQATKQQHNLQFSPQVHQLQQIRDG